MGRVLPIYGDVNGPDYILDIGDGPAEHGSRLPNQGALDQDGESTDSAPAPQAQGRPWLAVRWTCCQVYSRIYRNRDGTAYIGTCPRCGKAVRVAVGPDGTDCRFFEAY